MGWRGVFRSSRGWPVAAAMIVAGAAGLSWSIHGAFGPSEAASLAQDRIFACARTGKPFSHRLALSDSIPVRSPHSGEKTGYPAELCYWTADGKTRQEPSAVLLNSYLGRDGPTFCQDCGRLVVGHNPVPDGRRKPPPTRQQYAAARTDAPRRD